MGETTAEHFAAYIVVGSPEIFEKTRELGFTMHGLKSTRRKMAAAVRPGDRLIFYITGLKRFGGIVEVTSEMFEDSTPIWHSSKKPDERYPYRVHIKPEVIVEPDGYVLVEPLATAMTYTKKWPPQNWTLAFQGNLHKIPLSDYELIRDALTRAKQPAPV